MLFYVLRVKKYQANYAYLSSVEHLVRPSLFDALRVLQHDYSTIRNNKPKEEIRMSAVGNFILDATYAIMENLGIKDCKETEEIFDDIQNFIMDQPIADEALFANNFEGLSKLYKAQGCQDSLNKN